MQNFREKISSRELRLGFVVTIRVCAGMRTELREATENSGEEIFRELCDRVRTTLISNLLNDRGKLGILPEDLEYKNCPLDLTLTGT